MSTFTRVYWKRKEGVEADYVSGCCAPEDVYDYGEIGHCDLPTEIEVTHDEGGTMRAVSPPIIGGRYAYRYILVLTPSRKEEVASASDFALDQMIWTQQVEAPAAGAQTENWWWYAKDRFTSLGYGKKTPVTLMKNWKRGMLELLLETHPEKEEKLAQWDSRVDAHNSYVRRKSKTRTSAHRKAHGDLVVMPTPSFFVSKDETIAKQIFRYDIEPGMAGFGSKRAKHSLQIGATRYKIAHGPAMTFKDGTAPDETLSLPIRVAMCLLAWAETSMSSAHALLKAKQTFQDQADRLLVEMKDATALPHDEAMVILRQADISAAISALVDFRPRQGVKDPTPFELQGMKDISARVEEVLHLLKQAQSRLFPS